LLGSTLAPSAGSSTAATLNLGDTSLDAASKIHYQLGAPGTPGEGVNDLTVVNGNLTLAGSLSVSALTGFGAGVYELLSYTGSLIDNGLSLGTLPTGFSYRLDETSIPGEILLDVTSLASLTGDVNGDGIVNGQDLALVSSNWLHTGSGVTGDVNHDGIVNGQDLALVSSNWLHTSGAGALVTTSGVPEPSSFALLALGLASAAGAVRRRTTHRRSVNEVPNS
jgi:hypothetical protein